MPERDADMYSNPLAPTPMEDEGMDDAHPLTNEDFRKLLMTPRAPPSSATQTPAAARPVKPAIKTYDEEEDPALRRKKKKSYYAKLKKAEEEKQKELDLKYRDRARERREGTNTDYEQTEIMSTTADYRAVAPDAKSGESYAERRKQVIQESKYLGGDMEHTHLVKGLDYALLEKVRAEITNAEAADEDIEAALVTETKKEKEKEEEREEEMIQFRTKLGRNVYRQLFRTKLPERNELFLPGRMAYVVDLEDEFAESDIPCTLIRSKADCPSLESTTTLTTNDIVINKLTQILSYLRQGRRESKKLKKKEKGKMKEDDKPKLAEDSIYPDLTDYQPGYSKSRDKDRKDRDKRDKDREREKDRDRIYERERDREKDHDRDRGQSSRDKYRHERDTHRDRRDRGRHDRDHEREREKKKSYFEKPVEEEDVRGTVPNSAKEFAKSINDKFSKGWAPADLEREAGLNPPVQDQPPPPPPPKEDRQVQKLKGKVEINSYAECYPGMLESADAIDDSDDEVDYTKMDQGNKKGPIGRWDFDTQEEYSDYMANKEALPKAAFQYGVKMADGRKTRRTGPKDEKAQLDREWQKIQNIIAKRKQMGSGGDEPYPKSSKYS